MATIVEYFFMCLLAILLWNMGKTFCYEVWYKSFDLSVISFYFL